MPSKHQQRSPRKNTPQGNPLFAIITAMGFVWISYASMHSPVHHYAIVHKAVTLKQRQARALQELYNISDDEIAKPVVLFGE